MDVLVQPDTSKKGGIVVAEAELIGGPVIGTRMDEIRDLKDGWWDQGSRAPTESLTTWVERRIWRIVEDAGIPRPFIFPTYSGGIQCEWRKGDIDLDIVFGRDKSMSAHLLVGDEDTELETASMEELTKWLIAAMSELEVSW